MKAASRSQQVHDRIFGLQYTSLLNHLQGSQHLIELHPERCPKLKHVDAFQAILVSLPLRSLRLCTPYSLCVFAPLRETIINLQISFSV
jgi:hypothetical protein